MHSNMILNLLQLVKLLPFKLLLTSKSVSLISCLKKYPFKKLIIQAIPICKICADIEQILWHQRLGHPCDEYLYSTRKFIDNVPEFKRRSDVLSRCLTCIQAKQTKSTPGPNSTKRAMYFGQGLSIDFSFSGITSKNTKRR